MSSGISDIRICEGCHGYESLHNIFSNKSRALRLKKGIVRAGDEPLENDSEIEIIDVSEYETKQIPSKTWRECIKKLWYVDPFICPNCGGEMKISAFNLH